MKVARGLKVVCIATVLCGVAAAQAAKPDVEAVRGKLRQAAMAEALETAGTSPFRIEATYETFDYLGKPDGDGTLVEEWFARISGGGRRHLVAGCRR